MCIMLRRHGDDGLLETRCVVKMVFEHFEADIAQVLVGDVAEQLHGLDLLVLFLGVLHEVGDGLVVAPGLFKNAAELFVACIHDDIHLGFLAVGDVGIAQRVFKGYAAVVLGTHLGRHLGQDAGRGGRHHIEFKDFFSAFLMVEGDGDILLFARLEYLEAELAVFGGVGHHAAQAGCEPGLAILVGSLRDHGAEFGIVVDLELHGQVGLRIAILVYDSESGLRCLSVIIHHIDFCVVGAAADDFLGAIIIAEDASV